MIPRIKSVKPLENYLLQVVFDDGKSGIYDVKEDINTIPQYKDLQDIKGLFGMVKLDRSRTCVFWSDEIDLPSDAIYENLQDEPIEDEMEAIKRAKADTSPRVPRNEIIQA